MDLKILNIKRQNSNDCVILVLKAVWAYQYVDLQNGKIQRLMSILIPWQTILCAWNNSFRKYDWLCNSGLLTFLPVNIHFKGLSGNWAIFRKERRLWTSVESMRKYIKFPFTIIKNFILTSNTPYLLKLSYFQKLTIHLFGFICSTFILCPFFVGVNFAFFRPIQ